MMFKLIFLLFTAIVHGRVYDSKTGKPLPGVNVYIPGKNIGTATDIDGSYILELPPGKYTVKVSMLGYKDLNFRIDIKRPDQKIEQDFYLTQIAITIGKEILVKAKASPLKPEVSTTLKTISSRELEAMASSDIVSVLHTKAGITSFEDTDIHIRGSRSNEILLVIDGIPVKDPLAGTAFGFYVPTTAVKEVDALIGGFNAEYGQAMGGVINLKIKEGTDKFHGSFNFNTDRLKPIFSYFDTKNFNLTLSGPMFLKSKFFFNFYGRVTDTYLPHLNSLYSSVLDHKFGHELNTYAVLYKHTFNYHSTKFNLTLGKSIEVSQGYFYSRSDYPFAYGFPYRYIYNLEGYPVFTRVGEQASLSIFKILGTKSLIEAKAYRFFTNLRINVDNKKWTDYEELLDIYPQPSDTHPYIGDGFYDIGDAPYWHDHFAEIYGLKLDYTYKKSSVQKIKTGMGTEYSEVQWLDIQYPWYNRESGLGLNYDLYRAFTTKGYFYAQSNLHFAGMVANFGLRYDYWIPGKYVDRGVENALKNPYLHPFVKSQYQEYLNTSHRLPIFDLRIKGHLSPRAGVSFPVTDKDKFFFNYGHFIQIPDLKYIYSKLGERATATYELVGNPNLKPAITVAYEMGLSHLLTPFSRFTLTAYYKDIFNYPTAIKVPGIPPNPDFWMYLNSDYSHSLGIEFSFKYKKEPFFADIEATLSQSKGRASTSEDVYWRGPSRSLREWYLRWDRPYKFFLLLGIRTAKSRQRAFKMKLPELFSASISFSYQAGRRYTPVDSTGRYGEPNSRLGPPWFRMDLKLQKGFRLGKFNFWLVLKGYNITNHRNVYYVNPLTGRDYRPGDPLPPRRRPKDFLNPARYRSPRHFDLGISITW